MSDNFEPYIPKERPGIEKVDAAIEWLREQLIKGGNYAFYSIEFHIHDGAIKTVERTSKTRER